MFPSQFLSRIAHVYVSVLWLADRKKNDVELLYRRPVKKQDDFP